MDEKKIHFEQGPIRPPNEARSLLLRITRNCTWNKCLFCPVYKKKKFSRRSIEDIKNDIQTVRSIADDIKNLSKSLGFEGEINDQIIKTVFSQSNAYYANSCYKSIALWMHYGTYACFLQDADNLIIKTEDLVYILTLLLKSFPEIKRITTYSRSKTILTKSVNDLNEIRKAGLNRVHIGLETGYDPLLTFMKKGVNAKQHIEAGKRLIEAGIEVSEYVMPGLGGREMWREHAIHTAEVINQINPHFIRLRSLRIPEKVPLFEKCTAGDFTPQADDSVVEEIKLFIQKLENVHSTITSDHIMNLLEEITGKMPDDRQKILDLIDSYQALPQNDRFIFRIGKRLGYYRSLNHFHHDQDLYKQIQFLANGIKAEKGEMGLEKFITETADRSI
jgi:hypothetical protein